MFASLQEVLDWVKTKRELLSARLSAGRFHAQEALDMAMLSRIEAFLTAAPSAPQGGGVEEGTIEKIALLFTRSGRHFVGKDDRDECMAKAKQAIALTAQPRTDAAQQAPVGVEAAKHWHSLYRKECQLRQDDAARYGQQIVELEALAQQPAAEFYVDFPATIGTAGPFPLIDGRISIPNQTVQDIIARVDHQPAAVDGAALREVARQMRTRYAPAIGHSTGASGDVIANCAHDVAHTLSRWADQIDSALAGQQQENGNG